MNYFMDNINVIILIRHREDLDVITWNIFKVLDPLIQDLNILTIMLLMEYLDSIDRILIRNLLIHYFDPFFAAHGFFQMV